MKIKIILIIFLISNFQIIYAQNSNISNTIIIPKGTSIKVDGIITDSEWNNPCFENFVNGEKILFQHDGEYIYFGIVGDKGGFSSVCLSVNDTIYVYHASLGLITASYIKKNEDWIQIQKFRSDNQMKTKSLKNYELEKYCLDTFNWYSNTVDIGNPKNKEYKIPIDKIVNGKTRVSFTFFQIKAKNTLAFAPKNLTDESKNLSMIKGVNVENLKFMPETWFLLKW